MSVLSFDERQAIEQAQIDGYYIRSGRTIAALLAWRAWCRAHGVPAVVVAILPRKAFIEVGGAKVWDGPAHEAEQQARAIANSQARPHDCGRIVLT